MSVQSPQIERDPATTSASGRRSSRSSFRSTAPRTCPRAGGRPRYDDFDETLSVIFLLERVDAWLL
jgi:hypothetical protein